MTARNIPFWVSSAAFILLTVGLSITTFAHEGHNQPGALPSAPHGGKVKESTGGTNKGSETELFFEAVYQDTKLRLYPLTTDASGAYKALSPKKDLSNISVEIEFPRTGKRSKAEVTIGSDSLEMTVNTRGANRFLVIIGALHKGDSKKTKIQVETK